MRTILSLLPVAAILVGATLAHAQPDTRGAEALFRQGKTLMTEGKLAEACSAFEGSYRKDPATSTLLNIADCREKNGQFSSAWGAFVEAERRSRGSTDPAQQAINALSKERAAKLEPRISFLTISVPDEARVDGLVITRDDEPVDGAEWNRSLPADIGTHTIVAKAPAYESWSTTVTIAAEQEKQSVTIPKFRPLPKPKLGTKVDVIDPSPITAKRKLAIGLAAVGVVGIGTGIGLYFPAKSQNEDAINEPDNAKQKALWESANQKYLIAQIAGGVGVAALGAAAYLWFTGKPRTIERPMVTFAPSVTPTGAGLVAAGWF
ncbi:MAG: hypothetical protein IPL61_35995 [Myxococcales bacterium]|nr:hypothetical protein [Myxococcales bacterium]